MVLQRTTEDIQRWLIDVERRRGLRDEVEREV